MTRRVGVSIAVVAVLCSLGLAAAPCGAQAQPNPAEAVAPAPATPKPKATPKPAATPSAIALSDPAAAALGLLVVPKDTKERTALDAQFVAVAKAAESVPVVLEALAASSDPLAPSAQAELLLRAANDRVGKGGDSGLTDALAQRAAALLADSDPVVSALADWAISVRVNLDIEKRKFWPRPDPPEWYTTWAAQKPESFVAHDYVRQAYLIGAHRSVEGLLTSANDVVKRTQGACDAAKVRADAARVATMEKALGEARAAVARVEKAAGATPDLAAARRAFVDARLALRRAVLANPDLNFSDMVFSTRYSCVGAHNLASASFAPANYAPGGDIVVKSGFEPGDPVRSVLGNQLGRGSLRGMDLWWGADRVCFAFSKQPNWGTAAARSVDEDRPTDEPTHLYEIRLDGTGLRELTNDKRWIDTEPSYLPDGGVVFGTDRAGTGSECGGWAQNAGTLNIFKVTADAQTVSRLTINKDYDRYPHVLDTGEIAFMRWDYAERQFYHCHSIWTMRPDGTKADTVFKSHVQTSPMSVRDPRPVPGSSKIAVIATGHHNLAEGGVALVDTGTQVNDLAGMRYVTPHAGPVEGWLGNNVVADVEQGGVLDDGAVNKGGLYHTPWPLSERSFLVGYAYPIPGSSHYDLYFIDVWGNKELIHRDPVYEVVNPMAVSKRPVPPIIPDTTNPKLDYATVYVADVYSDLKDVPRGTVKSLRISERTDWFYDKEAHGMIRWVTSNPYGPQFGYWTWSPVRTVGTVPVAEDGSASFKVPANLAVYFQALDENGMEVRRMRSHISFQPGEVRGCLGCHETRSATPGAEWTFAQALQGEPAMPTPPPWGDRTLLDFEKHIQPILDRNCVSCHGAEGAKAGLDFTATRDAYGFAQSYRTMFGLKQGESAPVSCDPEWWKILGVSDAKLDQEWYKQLLAGKLPGQLVSVSDRTSTGPDASISQVREFGSSKSKLVTTLLTRKVHLEKAKLAPDDWTTLVTWVDANAPYRSAYFQKQDETGQTLKPPKFVEIPLRAPFGAAAAVAAPAPEH